jgi:hypothetical protein
VCAPLKIDFICSAEELVSGLGADLCDSSNVIDADFGSEYYELRQQEMKFTSAYSNISFDYEASNLSNFAAVRVLNETGRELSQALDEKVKLIDYIFRFCSRLMMLMYLKIIYGGMTASFSSYQSQLLSPFRCYPVSRQFPWQHRLQQLLHHGLLRDN